MELGVLRQQEEDEAEESKKDMPRAEFTVLAPEIRRRLRKGVGDGYPKRVLSTILSSCHDYSVKC